MLLKSHQGGLEGRDWFCLIPNCIDQIFEEKNWVIMSYPACDDVISGLRSKLAILASLFQAVIAMKIEYYGMFFTNLMKMDKYFVHVMHYDVIMAKLAQYFSFWLIWD